MRRIRYAALAAVLGLVSISAAHAAIESPIHRSFNVRPGGTIIIDADLGDIKVTSGGSNVSVDVIRRAKVSSRSRADELFKDLVLNFAAEGDNVRIHAKYDHPTSWFHWNNDLEVRFVVTVPSQYNVDLRTSGGDITVSDLNGQAKVSTSGGDVALGHIAGAVDAHTSGGDISMAGSNANAMLSTSGGDIKVDNTAGALNVKTSGGSIDIGRAQGDLKAHTSGGSIEIGDAGGMIDASTSGGSIKARLSRQPRGESRLSTSGGGITVHVASNVGLDIDAHTSGGDVDSEVPVTILGKQDDSSLNGKLNGGGPKLVLRSSGGDIRLQR
jgi:putative adhesin